MAKRNLYNPEQESMSVHTNPTTVTKPVYGVVTNCTRLNVRKKPHRGSDVLEIIEEDDTVTIIMHKSTRNWYYVQTESGTEGYSMADYIVRQK